MSVINGRGIFAGGGRPKGMGFKQMFSIAGGHKPYGVAAIDENYLYFQDSNWLIRKHDMDGTLVESINTGGRRYVNAYGIFTVSVGNTNGAVIKRYDYSNTLVETITLPGWTLGNYSTSSGVIVTDKYYIVVGYAGGYNYVPICFWDKSGTVVYSGKITLSSSISTSSSALQVVTAAINHLTGDFVFSNQQVSTLTSATLAYTLFGNATEPNVAVTTMSATSGSYGNLVQVILRMI